MNGLFNFDTGKWDGLGVPIKTGQVVIQTYNPEHYAIQLACRQDYEQFSLYEMNLRHLNNYPPYYYTIKITVSAKSEAEAAKRKLCDQKRTSLNA